MEKRDKVARRHAAIKELIKNNPIEDQQTLVELMKKQFGIDTNQSIVSRDLRALGVSKQQQRNKMIYEIPSLDASHEILRLAVVDVLHNEAVIIIKTLPGLAAFVGDFLDLLEQSEIAGTLAGENTVFVAPRSIKTIAQVAQSISRALNFKMQHEES